MWKINNKYHLFYCIIGFIIAFPHFVSALACSVALDSSQNPSQYVLTCPAVLNNCDTPFKSCVEQLNSQAAFITPEAFAQNYTNNCYTPYSTCTPSSSTSSSASTPSTEAAEWYISADQTYHFEEPIGDKTSVQNLTEYLVLVYNYALSLIGILAAVAVIFGGARWAMSAGNESAITAAKETIFGAIIGLVIAVGSYTILNFINPQLTTLKGANIMKIPILPSTLSTCSWKKSSDVLSTDMKFGDDLCSGSRPGLVTDLSIIAAASVVAPGVGGTVAAVGYHQYDCYCDGLGPKIVEAAQQHTTAKDLQFTCCWGWVNAVYDSVLASPVAQSSKSPSTIAPGDWLYINNGNSYGGLHSVIFLSWTNEADLTGQCVGASPNAPAVFTCNFNNTPIDSIFKPMPKAAQSAVNPGICGGMTAADLTYGT